ncbi:aldo/keto reductase [Thioclava sp. GXIMD4216]|uniref:aldo/keto reductase n=1 Tax=Thioclava sp. GXIMD4216 TaxID=3131929 RepID=UPI0030D1318D
MQHKPLGQSGLTVSPFVFCGNVLGWTADRATSFAMLDRLVEAGVTSIDTADSYSYWGEGMQGGESEAMIGDWLAARKRRDDVVIYTKVGKLSWRKGLRRENILAAIDESLTRLRTDYIDLYFAHADDGDVPQEEVLETFEMLRVQGKIRAMGASNFAPDRLASALSLARQMNVTGIKVVQPEYSLSARSGFEQDLLPLVKAQGLGAVTFFTLAAGFLSGKYRKPDDFNGIPRARHAAKYLDARGLRILGALSEVADGMGAPMAQVATAWAMAREGVSAPIVSASTMAQLETLLDAIDLHLNDEAMAKLEAASDG